MSILTSIFKFSFFTVISKISGFARDIALVAALGLGPMSDSFLIAFRLPNLFRAILADGALNMVFTPIYTQIRSNDKPAASMFANNIFTILTLVTAGFCTICVFCMPALIVIFAPGLDIDGIYFHYCLEAAKIMFPYLLFAAISALISGMLQADGKFLFVSLSPVILNIAMIFAAFKYLFHSPMIAVSWSVIISGIIQCILGLICLAVQSRTFLMPVVPKFDDSTHKLFNRLMPAILGSCTTRLSIWIDTVIASIIPNAVSYVYYADRLYQIPRSLIGIAISYVILPELSRILKSDDTARAHRLLNRAIEMGFVLCIPAAIGLTILSHKAAEILLMFGSALGDEHTDAIARVISLFAIAIPAVTSITIVNTMFYAAGDTAIPVKASLISVTLNAILNLVLIRYIGYISVPISTTSGAWVNFLILLHWARKKYNFTIDSRFTNRIVVACGASFAMGVVVCVVSALLDSLASGYVSKICAMLCLCGLGIMSYALILRMTKTYSLTDIRNMFDSYSK